MAERRDPSQGAVLRLWLNAHAIPPFNGRILEVDTAVVQRSAKLHVPDPRPVRDGLIAATALVHGLTIVTRNVADFEPTGVPTLNPWRGRGDIWHGHVLEVGVLISKRQAQPHTSTVKRLSRSGFTRHARIGICVVGNFDRAIQPHLHKGRACGRCSDAA